MLKLLKVRVKILHSFCSAFWPAPTLANAVRLLMHPL